MTGVALTSRKSGQNGTLVASDGIAMTNTGSEKRPTLAELEKSPLYSETLGIDLSAGTEAEIFRWFLASRLFGGRISETIATHTYQSFIRHGLTTPDKILAAGWDFLVNPVMREGGYVRYDESRSSQLLRNCERLLKEYDGKLSELHEQAADNADLEKRLEAFSGVGPVTANIFLRELRPWWKKADPEPLPAVYRTAEKLGIDLARYDHKSLAFIRLEAGLIRFQHHQ